jgi:hypothetical protein
MFTVAWLPAEVPVNFQLNVDAPGAEVQLVINDGNGGPLAQGASTPTFTAFSFGFFVTINDLDSTVSLAWQYETPTAHWPLTGSDDSVPLGRLGTSSACLIESRSAEDDQVIGVLRAEERGLTTSWVAAIVGTRRVAGGGSAGRVKEVHSALLAAVVAGAVATGPVGAVLVQGVAVAGVGAVRPAGE